MQRRLDQHQHQPRQRTAWPSGMTSVARRRPYHKVDDDGTEFDYELPDWLVGAD